MEIREFKETDLKEVKNFIDRSLKEELSGGQQKLPDNNLNNLRQIYEADKNIFLIVEEEEKIIAVIGVLNESNDVALIRRFFIHCPKLSNVFHLKTIGRLIFSWINSYA